MLFRSILRVKGRARPLLTIKRRVCILRRVSPTGGSPCIFSKIVHSSAQRENLRICPAACLTATKPNDLTKIGFLSQNLGKPIPPCVADKVRHSGQKRNPKKPPNLSRGPAILPQNAFYTIRKSCTVLHKRKLVGPPDALPNRNKSQLLNPNWLPFANPRQSSPAFVHPGIPPMAFVFPPYPCASVFIRGPASAPSGKADLLPLRGNRKSRKFSPPLFADVT